MKRVKKIALMAVGDDAWMGGIQYIINIAYALNEVAKERPLEVHIFKHPSQQFHGLEKFDRINLQVKEIDQTLPPYSLPNRINWALQRRVMGRKFPRLETYLVKEGYDFVYPALLHDQNGKLNSAAWIADFQYHHFPDGASAATTRAAEKQISTIAHDAKKIVFSSAFCENDGYTLFPVTKGKSFTLPFTVYINDEHLADDNLKGVLAKYGLPDDYIMVSNLFAVTKNHATLFNALGILKKQGIQVNLVCTGNIVDYRNHGFANEILQLLTRNGIRSQVHLLGLVPRIDQVSLYRMARALVQPSINEGWSTLVEEAKALGKNLVLSDIDVHKEQWPGNPYSFSSLSPDDLASKIKQLYSDTASKQYPDHNAETAAREFYLKKVKEFGEKFMAIAEA